MDRILMGSAGHHGILDRGLLLRGVTLRRLSVFSRRLRIGRFEAINGMIICVATWFSLVSHDPSTNANVCCKSQLP